MQNGLPLRSLNEALHLGRLGTQTVLISEKSFRNLTGAITDKTVYISCARILNAERNVSKKKFVTDIPKNDVFVLDILRDRRTMIHVQRILSI